MYYIMFFVGWKRVEEEASEESSIEINVINDEKVDKKDCWLLRGKK